MDRHHSKLDSNPRYSPCTIRWASARRWPSIWHSRMNPDSIDVAQQEAQAGAEGYLHRCLVAIDVCANVILLRGRQGETISAHAYRAALQNKLWRSEERRVGK